MAVATSTSTANISEPATDAAATQRQRLEDGKACLEAGLAGLTRGWSMLWLCPPDHVGVGKQHHKSCKSPGKAPFGLWGEFQTRLMTERELRSKHAELPNGNVGMAYGPVSGFVGIDVDGPAGEELLQKKSGGDLPETLEFKTPGGGRRLLYKIPDGASLRTTYEAVAKKEELRFQAKGAQTVLPPSRHESGRLYAWKPGHAPGEIEPALCPAWLVEALSARSDDQHRGNDKIRSHEEWDQLLAGVEEGSRHSTALAVAGKILASLGDLKNSTVLRTGYQMFQTWNRGNKPPLDDDELLSIWSDITAKEIRQREQQETQAFNDFSRPESSEKQASDTPAAVLATPSTMTPESNGHATTVEPPPPAAPGTPPQSLTPKPVGILLSTVQPEYVRWLWPARIPLAKLTILDGDPGLGKSTLTTEIAARVTKGWSMPDGEPGEDREPAGAVLLSAEDGLADTILPRLLAAGGDPGRVVALPEVPGDTGPRPPCLPLDVRWLTAAVKRVQAALVVIDPLAAFLDPDVNMHRDQHVRRALHLLARLADETGTAVVVVRHLNKGGSSNPVYRGGGSIGIIGAARSGLLVAKDPDDENKRVLAATKCNLARMPPSLSFALEPAGDGAIRIGWSGTSLHTAETLLAVPRDEEERGATAEAVEVLRTILAVGMLPAKTVKTEARKAGVSEPALKRAKAILGVRSRLVGFGKDGQWNWSLPVREGQTNRVEPLL